MRKQLKAWPRQSVSQQAVRPDYGIFLKALSDLVTLQERRNP